MVTPALLLLELALALATTTAATTPTTPSSRTGDLRKTFVTAHSFTLVFVRRMAPCPVSRRLTAHRAAAMPVHSVKISDSVPAVKCEARWNVPSPLHPGGPRPCPRMETLSKISYDAASLSLEKQERLIEEIRARTGLLLAASSLAVAFLGRAAVDSANTVLVSLALVAFAFSVGAAMYVLLPKSNLTFSLRGAGVYEGLYEFANDLDEVHRRLAYDLDAFWDANDVVVAQLLRWFKLSAIGVAAEIVLLTAAVSDTLL